MSAIFATSRNVAEGKLEWRKPVIGCHLIADITTGGVTTSGDGQSANGPAQPSDIRLKQDISEVGKAANGLKLYSFRYIGGEETFVGVMAQEVLNVKPEAVVTRADGFYAVDYDVLGVKMISVDKWRAAKSVH